MVSAKCGMLPLLNCNMITLLGTQFKYEVSTTVLETFHCILIHNMKFFNLEKTFILTDHRSCNWMPSLIFGVSPPEHQILENVDYSTSMM